jgi:hypothetical protein
MLQEGVKFWHLYLKYYSRYSILNMSFNNPFKKMLKHAAENAPLVVGATAAATVGAIGGTAMWAHEQHAPEGAKMPNFDTMPVDHVDPTAGQTADSYKPEPITIQRPAAEVQTAAEVSTTEGEFQRILKNDTAYEGAFVRTRDDLLEVTTTPEGLRLINATNGEYDTLSPDQVLEVIPKTDGDKWKQTSDEFESKRPEDQRGTVPTAKVTFR